MTFKMKKVFDWQDMPDGVLNAFFSLFENSNGSYVPVGVTEYDLEEAEEYGDDAVAVVKWLLANGATFEDDNVLISYCW